MRQDYPPGGVVVSLMLISGFFSVDHVCCQQMCNQVDLDMRIPWRPDPVNHTISWRLDAVCSTSLECFGYRTASDRSFQVQLCPLDIQLGDRVYIQPPPPDSPYKMRPVNVSVEQWQTCPDIFPPSTQYLPISSSVPIEIPKNFLQNPGTVYLAQGPNGGFSDCRYGLRVQIRIKNNECRFDNTTVLCQGRGECLTQQLEEHFKCDCTDGFLGEFCEQISLCYTNPCGLHGACFTIEQPGSGANFTCNCTEGYTGETCEEILGICSAASCNNATCEQVTETSYHCQCPEGYSGVNCSSEVNECMSDPCAGGGTCIDEVNGYTCHCPPGLSGRHCERKNPCTGVNCTEHDQCLSNPCLNGGQCINKSDGYFCQCVNTSFTGLHCELSVGQCNASVCQNNGTCIIHNNTAYSCQCQPHYTGHQCETYIPGCFSTPCYNNATCRENLSSGKYKCHCQPDYYGVHCEELNKSCDQQPCLNGATCIPGQNGTISNRNFSCLCPKEFQGDFCEVNVNYCDLDPCNSNQVCIDGIGNYTCQCLPGYTGVNCTIDIDDCSSHRCQQGATCIDGVNGYTCVCSAGSTGSLCQINVGDCSSQPCVHGDCLEKLGGYECYCKNGFTGRYCHLNYDDCLSQPCQNGSNCTDGIANFTCQCSPGYTGLTCEENIDECLSSQCQNGANCTDLLNDYLCGCLPGYTGKQCEVDIDECAASPCQNGGTCRDNINSFTCDCPPPFQGDRCQSLPCDLNPCGLEGNCSNDLQQLPHGFTCLCPPGLGGVRCQVNLDDCHGNTSVPACSGQGLCVDGLNQYTCLCQPGWKGRDCHIPVDECANHLCRNNATCVNQNDGYICACPPGYDGQLCDMEKNECNSIPCKNNGQCVDLFNDYRCQCSSAWTGKNCEVEVNECKLNTSNPCMNNGTCVDQLGNYSCVCQPFFTGQHCEVTFDPCDPAYDPCQHNATCSTNSDGTYNCTCLSGFSGTNCEVNTDECYPPPCINGGHCEDQIAAYMCHCLSGFTGRNCETNINDCDHDFCQNNSTCHDLVNGYICNCTSSYTGLNCTDDVNECLQSPCQNNASCQNYPGGYRCRCRQGFTGAVCEENIDDCLSSPCQHGGTCVDGTAVYSCVCTPGFTGVNCEIDVDECDLSPCEHGNCTDKEFGYNCTCDLGWTGRNCSIDVDDCAAQPCQNGGVCQDNLNGFECLCPPGFVGPRCEFDVDVCENGNFSQCLNGGRCVDGRGDRFTCLCSPGYTGSRCEINEDDCASNPCQNAVACVDGINNYTCICHPGWTGELCETDIDECLSIPCQQEGICRQLTAGQGFECLCPAGFGGEVCERNYDDCLPEPRCLNGGKCSDGINTYTCQCPMWTTGRECEVIILTPSPSTGGIATSSSSATGSHQVSWLTLNTMDASALLKTSLSSVISQLSTLKTLPMTVTFASHTSGTDIYPNSLIPSKALNTVTMSDTVLKSTDLYQSLSSDLFSTGDFQVQTIYSEPGSSQSIISSPVLIPPQSTVLYQSHVITDEYSYISDLKGSFEPSTMDFGQSIRQTSFLVVASEEVPSTSCLETSFSSRSRSPNGSRSTGEVVETVVVSIHTNTVSAGSLTTYDSTRFTNIILSKYTPYFSGPPNTEQTYTSDVKNTRTLTSSGRESSDIAVSTLTDHSDMVPHLSSLQPSVELVDSSSRDVSSSLGHYTQTLMSVMAVNTPYSSLVMPEESFYQTTDILMPSVSPTLIYPFSLTKAKSFILTESLNTVIYTLSALDEIETTVLVTRMSHTTSFYGLTIERATNSLTHEPSRSIIFSNIEVQSVSEVPAQSLITDVRSLSNTLAPSFSTASSTASFGVDSLSSLSHQLSEASEVTTNKHASVSLTKHNTSLISLQESNFFTEIHSNMVNLRTIIQGISSTITVNQGLTSTASLIDSITRTGTENVDITSSLSPETSVTESLSPNIASQTTEHSSDVVSHYSDVFSTVTVSEGIIATATLYSSLQDVYTSEMYSPEITTDVSTLKPVIIDTPLWMSSDSHLPTQKGSNIISESVSFSASDDILPSSPVTVFHPVSKMESVITDSISVSTSDTQHVSTSDTHLIMPESSASGGTNRTDTISPSRTVNMPQSDKLPTNSSTRILDQENTTNTVTEIKSDIIMSSVQFTNVYSNIPQSEVTNIESRSRLQTQDFTLTTKVLLSAESRTVITSKTQDMLGSVQSALSSVFIEASSPVESHQRSSGASIGNTDAVTPVTLTTRLMVSDDVDFFSFLRNSPSLIKPTSVFLTSSQYYTELETPAHATAAPPKSSLDNFSPIETVTADTALYSESTVSAMDTSLFNASETTYIETPPLPMATVSMATEMLSDIPSSGYSQMLSLSSTTSTVYSSSYIIVSPTSPAPRETCANDPCLNGGTCNNLTNTGEDELFRCMCSQKFYGSRCQHEKIWYKFQGNGYLSYPPLVLNSTLTVSLSFRTLQENAILFYAASNFVSNDVHYMRLVIEDSLLKYQFSCVVQEFDLNSGVRVNTNNRFKVTVKQNSHCKAQLTLENSEFNSKKELGMPFVFESFLFSSVEGLFMGGLPDGALVKANHANFSGCITDVTIIQETGNIVNTTNRVNVSDCTDDVMPPSPTPNPTCSHVRCSHGGTCRNIVTPGGDLRYHCDCKFRYHGDLCEQETSIFFPSFSGHSYLQHEILQTGEPVTALCLSVKTSLTSGTLLYSQMSSEGRFLHLLIEGRAIQYQLSCSQSSILHMNAQIAANSGNLTTVCVRQTFTDSSCTASLQVDDLEPTNMTLTGTDQVTPFRSKVLYLGGLPNGMSAFSGALTVKGFTGCMRHLHVNNRTRLVFQESVQGQNVVECNVPACSYQPCLNNGSCNVHESGKGWYCTCHHGYQGAMCQKTPCDLDPCAQGSTCIHLRDEAGYVCLCPYGRQGLSCERELDISRPFFDGIQYGYPSYLAFPPVRNWEFEFELQFGFTLQDTSQSMANSLMMYSGQTGQQVGTDYLAVGIQDGHLVFMYDLGSGPVMIKSVEPISSNLTSHEVKLGRKYKNGWLKLDSQSNVTGQSPGQLIGLNVYSSLFIGGYDELAKSNVRFFQNTFKGCIYDVSVRAGYRTVQLTQALIVNGRNVGQCNISQCQLNACKNGGTCIDLEASFRCNCTSGWMGSLCTEKITPCHSGHDCTPGSVCSPLSGGGYTCHCQLGRQGPRCGEEVDISDADFISNRSYMAFTPVRGIGDSTEVQIQFMPRSTDSGLLLYMAQLLSPSSRDFLSLSLHQGEVQLRYNLGTDPVTIVRSSRVIRNDSDEWHTVVVGRNGSHGYIILDGHMTSGSGTPGSVLLDVNTLLYVGGLPDFAFMKPEAMEGEQVSYQGCIRELVINGRQLQLTKTDAAEGLDIGDCDGTACGFHACKNGGNCSVDTNRTSGFYCNCTEMYHGPICETPSLCRDHSCAGAAICVSQEEQQTFTCACPLGFMGDRCENAFNFTSAQFRNGSYIVLQRDAGNVTINMTKTYVSFNISTKTPDGLLMWNEAQDRADHDDYFGAGFVGGHLKVILGLGGWSKFHMVTDEVLTDGQWHSVVIIRDVHHLQVIVDGHGYTQTTHGKFTDLDTSTWYYIGGVSLEESVAERTDSHFTQAFIGCMKDFMFTPDGSPVDLQMAPQGRNILSCDSQT